MQEKDKGCGIDKIEEVCQRLQEAGITKKYRGTVYYLLAKEYGYKPE